MKKPLAALLLVASMFVPAGAAGACADPVSGNDPLVWRSLSGVEVEWYVSVPAGCSGAFKVVVYRPNATDPLDPRSSVHYNSGTFNLGPGEWSVNALITKSGPAHAILFVNGAVYRILPVDTNAVP